MVRLYYANVPHTYPVGHISEHRHHLVELQEHRAEVRPGHVPVRLLGLQGEIDQIHERGLQVVGDLRIEHRHTVGHGNPFRGETPAYPVARREGERDEEGARAPPPRSFEPRADATPWRRPPRGLPASRARRPWPRSPRALPRRPSAATRATSAGTSCGRRADAS